MFDYKTWLAVREQSSYEVDYLERVIALPDQAMLRGNSVIIISAI